MPGAHAPKDQDRAKLIALDFNENGEPEPKGEEHTANVQFNPETLEVRYRNKQTGGELPGSPGVQHVGRGSTTLRVDLLFDVTRPGEGGPQPNDVRDRTKEVNWFMRELEKTEANGDTEKYVPSGVRFIWGSFQFDGVMTSMDENLKFFDPEGHPLRAEVSITISKQEIEFEQRPNARGGAGIGASVGANVSGGAGGGMGPEDRPEGAENTTGTSVQQVAAQQGRQGNWKDIAAESGVENPRAVHNPDALTS